MFVRVVGFSVCRGLGVGKVLRYMVDMRLDLLRVIFLSKQMETRDMMAGCEDGSKVRG